MCWACEHPQATLQDYLGHLRSIIAAHGWAVQAVMRERLRPPFAYTVGLTALGLPELVVTGMPAARATGLLNTVASHALHAAMPEPGERIPLIGGPLIEIAEVDVPSAHLLMAVELYGPGVRAYQVLHADDRGRWPTERGYQGGQPVLGTRAPAGGNNPGT